jgi:hypothetical protein
MATLADVIRSKRKSGQSRTGSFFGSLKDKLKETIDPRQIFNQTGILTSLFPSLKAYKAKGVGEETGKMIQRRTTELSTAPQSVSEMDLSVIEKNTKISAVNSMALPGLSRDVNVMRQNISKLVENVRLKPATKADNFFKKSAEREKEFESKFKTRPKLTGPNTTISDEEEKSKGFLGSLLSIVGGLIKAITTTIGKIFSTLFTLLQGLVTSLFTTLKIVLTTVITSLFGLFKTSIGKLLKSLGKVFSLMGGGRLLGIIRGLLFGPAGLVILAGSIAAALIKMAFINDEEKQKLFLDLDDLVTSGNASPEQIALHTELASKGFRKDPRTIQMDLTKPSAPSTISAIREELQRKPGDKDYKDDDEIKSIFGVSRATLSEFVSGNPLKDTLKDAEDRLNDPALRPLPEETTSPGIINNQNSTQFFKEQDQKLNKQNAIDRARILGNRTSLTPKPESVPQNNTGQSIVDQTSNLDMLAEEAGSYTNIQSMNLPTQETASNDGGTVRARIASVINPDYPPLPGMA